MTQNRRISHPEQKKLLDALRSEDELGVVVRSHILIESLLIKLIELAVPFPSLLKRTRFGFPQKVDLALSMGLKKQYGPPLKKLGSIRNDFAHKPDALLSSDVVQNLYQSFDQDDQKVVISTFETTKGRVARAFKGEFGSLDPKDRFVFIVVALHAALLAATLELEGE